MSGSFTVAFACFVVSVSAYAAESFQTVAFQASDGARIYGNLYGEGDRAVVLAHGRVFDKESWHPLAERIAVSGVQALAIDFRGYGKSQKGKNANDKHLDLVAAVAFLKERGLDSIALLGASMGGAAAAKAAVGLDDGALDKLILLAPPVVISPKALTGDKVFIVSEGDGLRKTVESVFDKASDPKRLEIVPGDAHAQHIFKTPHGEALMEMIVAFLGK